MLKESPNGTGYKHYITSPDEVIRIEGTLIVRLGERYFNVHPKAPAGSVCAAIDADAYWVRWELAGTEIEVAKEMRAA